MKFFKQGKRYNIQLLIIVVLCILLGFTYYTGNKQLNTYREMVKNPLFRLSKTQQQIMRQGWFVLTKDGVSEDFTRDPKVKKIVWYTDPYCPDCRNAHKALESLLGRLDKGEIEIKFAPLNYLAKKSPDDYSLKASAAILGVAIFQPEAAIDTINAIYRDERPDPKAVNSGVGTVLASLKLDRKTMYEIDKAYKETLQAYILKSTNDFYHNRQLKARSIKEGKELFVPYIYISNSKGKVLNGEAEDYKTNILNPLLSNNIINTCKQDKDC